MITFQRKALLQFYDEKHAEAFESRHRGSNVSAITGVIGEELLLALFLDCLRRRDGVHGSVLHAKPRRPAENANGTRIRGNWLDAWLKLPPERLGLVEVKNWSVHSLSGGASLVHDAPDEEVQVIAKARWTLYFGKGHQKMPTSVKKILHDYPFPPGYGTATPVERILCFWQPISLTGTDARSRAEICGKNITVFSGSIYLRQVEDEQLELHCPRIEERLTALGQLCTPGPRAPALRAVA